MNKTLKKKKHLQHSYVIFKINFIFSLIVYHIAF